jgi:hypothetical protein
MKILSASPATVMKENFAEHIRRLKEREDLSE